MTTNTNEIETVEVTQADVQFAEEIVSVANIVSHDGYYEVDIFAVAHALAHHRLAAASSRVVAVTDEMVQYIARWGGHCRDCADELNCCHRSGIVCGENDKAIRWVFDAYNYGIAHGYLSASPSSPAATLEVEREGHGLGPNAVIVDGDGYHDVAVLSGALTILQQGDATICISGSWGSDLTAALRTPPAPAGEGTEAAYKALSKWLTDPAAVHINMLAGGIAKPSPVNIWHLYGNDALIEAMPEDARHALATTGFIAGRDAAAGVVEDGAATEGWARANDVRAILESYARAIRKIEAPGKGGNA